MKIPAPTPTQDKETDDNTSTTDTPTVSDTSVTPETPATPNPETKTWTVTYKSNTKTRVIGMPSDKTAYHNGKTVTVKGIPVNTAAFFNGWNTKADGSGKSYTAGKTFKITGNITLYAQWKTVHTTSAKLRYKVTGTKTVACVGTVDKKAKTIKIPKTITYRGITYKVTSIAKKAFWKNKVITTVSIGNNVKTIGDGAFYKCRKLKKVTIGTGLTSMGRHLFCGANRNCIIIIQSKNLKRVDSAIDHSVKNMIVKVPKSKVKAYKKLFSKYSKKITVKAK